MLANMYGPKSGGIKTTLNSLSQQYEKLGHEVLVITPSDKDFVEQVGFIKKVSIASPSIPYTGGYRIIVRSKKIIEVLNSFHPDIIEISDRTTLISVARWARGKKIPTVFFAHERLDGVLSAKFLLSLPNGTMKSFNELELVLKSITPSFSSANKTLSIPIPNPIPLSSEPPSSLIRPS